MGNLHCRLSVQVRENVNLDGRTRKMRGPELSLS